MRGDEKQQEAMFSYVSSEARVPADHPLRAIRGMVDRALADRRKVVIVDVLETRAKVEVYAALAEYHGAQFAVFTRAGEYGSIHKVPLYVRQEMLARWQDYACESSGENLKRIDDLVRG